MSIIVYKNLFIFAPSEINIPFDSHIMKVSNNCFLLKSLESSKRGNKVFVSYVLGDAIITCVCGSFIYRYHSSIKSTRRYSFDSFSKDFPFLFKTIISECLFG